VHKRPFWLRQSGLAKNCSAGCELQRENTSSRGRTKNRTVRGHGLGFRLVLPETALPDKYETATPGWSNRCYRIALFEQHTIIQRKSLWLISRTQVQPTTHGLFLCAVLKIKKRAQ